MQGSCTWEVIIWENGRHIKRPFKYNTESAMTGYAKIIEG